MQELIKMVTDKAGISESQAKTAVETVVSFLKDKMPGVGSQVESFVKGEGVSGTASSAVSGMKDKLGGTLGK